MKFTQRPVAVGVLAAALLDVAAGVRFPVQSRRRSSVRSLGKRSTVSMTGTTSVSDSNDLMYLTNITLGGAQFTVSIDTGSPDLWVQGKANSTSSDINSSITYAAGSLDGPISFATLEFANFTVEKQAFINATETQDLQGEAGIIGLGPSAASNIAPKLNGSEGNTPLDNIFLANPTAPNILTFILSREDGAEFDPSAQNGELSINEVIPGHENITSSPQLPVLQDQFHVQHWQTVLDKNGFIAPNGQAVNTSTLISDNYTDQMHVVIDSGFSFPQVPAYVADNIYSVIPGSKFNPGSSTSDPGYYTFPCDYEVNITFIFGGVQFPIHPLDIGIPASVLGDASGADHNTCTGTFQPISNNTADSSGFGSFDAIFGMAFLRNSYTLINFGDFIEGSSNLAAPYIQLIPLTDRAQAHQDFVKTRLNGVDTTGTQAALLNATSEPTTSTNANSDDDSDVDKVVNDVKNLANKSVWYIVGFVVGGVVLLAALITLIWCCCKRSKARQGPGRGSYTAPFMPGMRNYQQLHDPQQGRPESPVWDSNAGPGERPPPYKYQEPEYRYGAV